MNGKFYKWELLIWLWLAFFFNQADRQIFNIVLPLIKTDLALSDAQLGLVSSIFVLTLGLCIPFAGFAGDLYNKKKIIVISLLFWSAATMLTGLSTTLIHLILLRSLAVGGGEAFYAPSANGMISHFHQKTRGIAMSIHQTSLYAGLIMSGLIGGWIAQKYGWKSAFYVFGGAGLILSVCLAFRLKNIEKEPGLATPGRSFAQQALRAIIAKPSAVLLCLAFLAMVATNVGYTTWMPTFLHEKFGLSVKDAGFASMFYHHIFAFAGVIAGGLISDKLAASSERKRTYVQFAGMLLGAPFIFLMGQSDNSATTYLALSCFGFFRGMYEANIYATLFAVVEPAYRSSAVGLSAMFAFVIASVVPFALGYLKPTLGLSDGLSSLSLLYLIGAIAIGITSWKFFKKDSVSTT
jgi:sugar phosphate permease